MTNPHDDELAAFEAARRWADVVRLLDQRAGVAGASVEARVDACLRMMRIYNDRFANQALACAAAERALELDVRQADAITYLRETYGKRREHVKLAALEARLR